MKPMGRQGVDRALDLGPRPMQPADTANKFGEEGKAPGIMAAPNHKT